MVTLRMDGVWPLALIFSGFRQKTMTRLANPLPIFVPSGFWRCNACPQLSCQWQQPNKNTFIPTPNAQRPYTSSLKVLDPSAC